MTATVRSAPTPRQGIDAMVCWIPVTALKPQQKLATKHTTRIARAPVKDIRYRLDVNTLHRDQVTKELAINEIGHVQPRTTVPLPCRRCATITPQTGPRGRSPDRRGDRGD